MSLTYCWAVAIGLVVITWPAAYLFATIVAAHRTRLKAAGKGEEVEDSIWTREPDEPLAESVRVWVECLKVQHETADKTNLHEDGMLVWFVGLAAGVIGLGVTLLPAGAATSLPWLTIVMVAPLIISAFTGVMARMLMARLLQLDRESFASMVQQYIVATRRPNESNEKVADRFLRLIFSRQERLRASKQLRSETLLPWINRFSQICQLEFAIGMLWLFGLLVLQLAWPINAVPLSCCFFKGPG